MSEPESADLTSAERLQTFVSSAKQSGITDESLVTLLRQHGWSERNAYGALSSYYERTLGLTIPARGPRGEYASEAFMHLIAFISLAFWTTALGQLLFRLIERAYPSNAYYASGTRESVAWELATIIVAFPIFALVSRSIASGLRARPESADSGVRKWLTYLALVIAAIILIGDAVWFISAFLTSALTVPLVLRTLVLTSIAGSIFIYYLGAIRGAATSAARDRLFGGLAGAAAVAGLALGFFSIGAPAHVREVGNDDRRVQNLRGLSLGLHYFAQNKRRLPLNLKALQYDGKDPVTGDSYGYRRLGKTAYELCATFDAADSTPATYPFVHPRGRKCFSLDATLTY